MGSSQRNPRPTLAIAGGYSSGHVTPGLAIADWAGVHLPEAAIRFFGSAHGPERKWVEQAGYAFTASRLPPFRYQTLGKKIRIPWAYLAAARDCAVTFRKEQVRLLVCLGSFASAASTLAAMLTRTPIVVFEPNAFAGLGNRLAGLRADSFFVTSLWNPSSRRLGTTARLPLRPGMANPRVRTIPDPGRPLRLLVLGGSLGHGFLNRVIPEVLGAYAAEGETLEIRHQCGLEEPDEPIRQAYQANGIKACVESFLDPIVDSYHWADFALTAAGAVTLHELAAQRLPCMVFPLIDAADDHQTGNAERFAAYSSSPVINPQGWTREAILNPLKELRKSPESWEAHWVGMDRFFSSAEDSPWQQTLVRLWEQKS